MDLSTVLIVGIGIAEIIFGGLVLLRRRAVEAWLAKRFARVTSLDADEGFTEPRPDGHWVPGRLVVVAVAIGALIAGAISIAVGLAR
jgi:hypothetical protein